MQLHQVLTLAFTVFLLDGFTIATANATPTEQFNYMLNCQGCHLPDGSGFPAHNVPDLRNQMGKFLFVPGGREFIVQVPGSAQSDLDDQALADLLNWMLQTFSPDQLPANLQPYTGHEVAQLRQQPLTYVTEVRNQLMLKIKDYEQQNP